MKEMYAQSKQSKHHSPERPGKVREQDNGLGYTEAPKSERLDSRC